jgi:hypothetical protein
MEPNADATQKKKTFHAFTFSPDNTLGQTEMTLSHEKDLKRP